MTANRARSEKLLRIVAFLVITSLLTISGFSVATADPAALTQAQKDAQALRQLIDNLDAKVGAADEDYNQAAEQLKATQAAEAKTQTKLGDTQKKLGTAQQRLMQRLADIYKGGNASALEVLFGASSFSDIVNRLGQLTRIGEQDHQLVADVQSYLDQVKQRQAELAQQKKDEQTKVARLGDAKKKVEAQLAAQKEALKGKETQIAQLQQEEAARQAQLAAAAKAAAAKAAAEAAEQAKLRAAAQSAPRPVSTTAKPTTSASGTTSATHKTTTTTEKESSGGGSSDSGSSGGSGGSGGSSGSSASGTRAKVIDIAMQYLGVPYVWAGASPDGFDCSGFVLYVFNKVGIDLPHSSAMQYNEGTHVSKDELQPGDLVFFYSPIHHVGIYIGDGQMINSRTGGVQIDNAFWSSYAGATRILD